MFKSKSIIGYEKSFKSSLAYKRPEKRPKTKFLTPIALVFQSHTTRKVSYNMRKSTKRFLTQSKLLNKITLPHARFFTIKTK